MFLHVNLPIVIFNQLRWMVVQWVMVKILRAKWDQATMASTTRSLIPGCGQGRWKLQNRNRTNIMLLDILSSDHGVILA